MAFFPSSYLTGKINFPSTTTEDKGKEYFINWAKAILSTYAQGRGETSTDSSSEVKMNRLYAEGNQPTEKYYNEISYQDPKTGERGMFVNISLDNVSIMPMKIETVLNTLLKMDNIPSCVALDENALNQKQRKQWEMIVDRELAPLYDKAGLKRPGGYTPASDEEQEMYIQSGGLKLVDEITIEAFCRKTLYDSDWEYSVRRDVLKDFITNSMAVVMDVVDPFTQEVRVKYCDLEFVIIPYSKDPTFKDIPYWGYIDYITEQNLRKECEGQVDSMDLEQYIERYTANWSRRPMTNPAETSDSEALMYPILRFEFLDNENKQYEIRETNGTELYFKVPYKNNRKDKGSRRYKSKSKYIVYECSWPIDADFIFNNRKKTDVVYEDDKPKLSCHIYKMSNKSMVSQCIPILDDIQLTILRKRIANAVAAPDGFAFDVSATTKLPMGGKDWDSLEIMDMYTQTGRYPFSSLSHPSQYQGASPPIIPISGGSGNYYRELLENEQRGMQLINEISGINEFVSGTSTDGRVPVGTMKQSVESAHNIIFGYHYAYSAIQRSMLTSVAKRWQIIAMNSEKELNTAVIGEFGSRIFKLNSDLPLRKMGIYIIPKPGEDLKAEIRLHAAKWADQKAATGVGINSADYFFILRMLDEGNLKMAQLVLSDRIEKAQQRQERMVQENQQMSQMAGIKTEEAKTQGKAQLMQTQGELDLTLQREDSDAQYGVQILKGEQKLREIERAGAFKGK